jgi:hypothetical protein
MHPLFDRLLRFFCLHAYTHSGSTEYLRIVDKGWVLTLEPEGEKCLVSVFCFSMASNPSYNDTKPIYLFFVGVFNDGSTGLLDPSTFQCPLDSGLTATVTTLTEATQVPGTNITAPVGANVYTVPPTNTPEEVTASPTGFPNGVTLAPFELDEAPAPPPVLQSVGVVPVQPS